MPPMRSGAQRLAVGLYRMSTAEQGQSGFGLQAQQASGGKDDRRPGFRAALARCRQLGVVLAAARSDRMRAGRTRGGSC
jgi:hypothetical protein